jgi:hypothetical protein
MVSILYDQMKNIIVFFLLATYANNLFLYQSYIFIKDINKNTINNEYIESIKKMNEKTHPGLTNNEIKKIFCYVSCLTNFKKKMFCKKTNKTELKQPLGLLSFREIKDKKSKQYFSKTGNIICDTERGEVSLYVSLGKNEKINGFSFFVQSKKNKDKYEFWNCADKSQNDPNFGISGLIKETEKFYTENKVLFPEGGINIQNINITFEMFINEKKTHKSKQNLNYNNQSVDTHLYQNNQLSNAHNHQINPKLQAVYYPYPYPYQQYQYQFQKCQCQQCQCQQNPYIWQQFPYPYQQYQCQQNPQFSYFI